MRSWTLLVAISSVLLVALPGGADEAPALDDAAGSAPAVRWEDFDDPEFDPTAPDRMLASNRNDAVPAAARSTSARASSIPLGQLVVDADGVEGRIHIVSAGETLWDISGAYLGTPWVWPSVWDENAVIENPHVIRPGDRLWITSTEIRLISEQEANEMVEVAAPIVASASSEPAGPIPEELPLPSFEPEQEELPSAVPLAAGGMPETGRVVSVSWRESLNFVAPHKLDGTSSIVESPVIRNWLAQGDPVFVGLGEGEVSVGDQFTVFRDSEAVIDPETGQTVGYAIHVLGWLEVEEVGAEASRAEVRLSISEIARGDRVMRREPLSSRVAVKMAQESVEARIIYMPIARAMIGPADYVFLNRGSLHGLEVGTELEVFDAGSEEHERVRGITVRTPDTIIADLVVISAQPEAAVAYVTATSRELEVGDAVRGSSGSPGLAQIPPAPRF